MKACHILCVVMLVVLSITITACSTTDRYIASSSDLQKFEQKENWQENKHRTTEK